MLVGRQPVRPGATELRFGRHSWLGVIIVLAGLVILYLASQASPGFYHGRNNRFDLGIIGAISLLVGLAAVFGRNELTLDLQSRMFTRRQGWWPNLRTTTGSMDQIEVLTLELETRRGSYRTYNLWLVRLHFKGQEKGMVLRASRNESVAYTQFESLARALEVPALDRTGPGQKLISPGRAGSAIPASRPPREPGLVPDSIPPLPPQSRILLQGEPLTRRILLPRRGLNAGSVALAVCGLFSCWIGGVLLQAVLTEPPVPENSPLIGPAFILLGLIFLLVALGMALAREVAEENGEQLQFGRRAFGFLLGTCSVRKDQIELIALQPRLAATGRSVQTAGSVYTGPAAAPSGANQVFIRSTRGTVRMGDRLTSEELQWLLQAVQAICARS